MRAVRSGPSRQQRCSHREVQIHRHRHRLGDWTVAANHAGDELGLFRRGAQSEELEEKQYDAGICGDVRNALMREGNDALQ